MEIIEPIAIHNFFDGVIMGKTIKSYQKKFAQISSIYADSAGISDDTLMYTVYSMEEDPSSLGELYWGLTVLEPVLVNGECNMTRGHFHVNRECAEFYFGTGGEGLLMLMDEFGTTWAERVYKGSLHHIPGKYAHRIINTGDCQLKVGACWPAAAGHDYVSIEKHEFAYRIKKSGTDIVMEDRDR